jgi:hypothetical protein
LVAPLCFAGASLTGAPAAAQDTSLEKIEEVDPYTKGDRAAMQRAGYVSFGPFHWAAGHSSENIKETLGGLPMVFIETAHFRLASNLETHKLTEDKVEKQFIEAELVELKKTLPKVKPTQKIDPWLRAHLYAARLEKLYADFCQRFGIEPADFAPPAPNAPHKPHMGEGAFLGQKDKFTVLLTEKRASLARYLRVYPKYEQSFACRYPFDDCMFYGANFEALKELSQELDLALYCGVAGAVVQNFVDGFRDSNQVTPEWFRYGIAHWFSRRVDARWNQWKAGGPTVPSQDDNWIWEPRVLGLVKNEACLSWEAMMQWKSVEDIQPREHMVAWSRVDWLLSRKVEERRAWLFALTEPMTSLGDQRLPVIRERELAAQRKLWNQDPAALDQTWRAWVLKTYKR